jgi:hypothetical protein
LPAIGELLCAITYGAMSVVVEVGSRSVPSAMPIDARRRGAIGARLNPDFGFATFVECKSNQLTPRRSR